MKYFKVMTDDKVSYYGEQPNGIVPSFAVEITEEVYKFLETSRIEKAKAIADYTEKVKAGEITLADVPEEYYSEVDAIVNAPEPEEPDPRQSLIDELISEVNA